MLTGLVKILLGELKRFEVKLDTDDGLIFLKYSQKKNIPSNLTLPPKKMFCL
jgi:hypothetical protein